MLAQPFQGRVQRRVLQRNEIAEQVQLPAQELGGDLDACDDVQLRASSMASLVTTPGGVPVVKNSSYAPRRSTLRSTAAMRDRRQFSAAAASCWSMPVSWAATPSYRQRQNGSPVASRRRSWTKRS